MSDASVYEQKCAIYNSSPLVLTIEDLYAGILRMVTFGDWKIIDGGDNNDVNLAAKSGQELHIQAFTNQLLNPSAGASAGITTAQRPQPGAGTTSSGSANKRYEEYGSLKSDIGQLLDRLKNLSFSTMGVSPGSGGGKGGGSVDDLYKKFIKAPLKEAKILNNLERFEKKEPLKTFNIDNWQLIQIKKYSDQEKFDTILPADYQLVFRGRSGGIFVLDFLKNDVLYFCDYPKPRKRTIQPATRVAEITTCRSDSKKPKQQTIKEFVLGLGEHLTDWTRTGKTGENFYANNIKDGINIIGISGYDPNYGKYWKEDFYDNRRLVGVTKLGNNLWQLDFVFVNSTAWKPNTSFILYGDDKLKLAVCGSGI